MGEAKRRKRLDSTYGNTPLLNSPSQKQKHVDLIVNALSSQFETELKQIASAESIIEHYDRYKDKVSDWLNEKLQSYREQDRTLIASSIMACYAEIAMEYEASPLLIKFFFEILEPLLSEDKSRRIASIVQKIEAELTKSS